ncbi:MAG: peptidase and in kexin sedolisin [Variovorax sp.]|nr:peptidase and in kexin sedolisin [Variovorax sp.]
MPRLLTLDRLAVADTASPRPGDTVPGPLDPFVRLPLAVAGAPVAVAGVVAEHEVHGDVLNLLRGIDRLLEWNVDAINLSLGPAQEALQPDHPLAVAVRTAWERGVVVVVAAGNWGPEPDSLQPLAQLPQVIAVGATDDAGVLLDISSRGTPQGAQPTVVAPGTTRSLPGVPDFDAGTSFAAPKVAGLSVVVLRALQLLKQDFVDHLRDQWSTFTRPVRRPVLGIADTGVNPAALPDRSQEESMTWRGGDTVKLSRGDRDRAWIAGVHEGLGRLGVSCSLAVDPGTVRRALQQAADPLPGRASWECGAGLLDEPQVLAWLSDFKPSRFVELFAARAPDAVQRNGIAALDAKLGPRWDDGLARYFLILFRRSVARAIVKIL